MPSPPPVVEPRLNLGNTLAYFGIHAVGLVAVFWVPATVSAVVLCGLLYFVRMIGITVGFHRYFAHRSFQTSRGLQFILALLGTAAAQKGVLWWAATHRHHHQHSDTEKDCHSPYRHGFVWAHVGWFLSSQHRDTKTSLIQDFARYPEIRWLDRFHVIPPAVLAGLSWLFAGAPGLVWGFGLSTVLTWHATYAVNSLAHVFGARRYETGDESRNSLLVALVTLGEGWHNNHHHYPSAARQGFHPWEVDISYYVIWLLERAGLVWNVRPVPASVLLANRLVRKDHRADDQ